jgi:hypothetical protein
MLLKVLSGVEVSRLERAFEEVAERMIDLEAESSSRWMRNQLDRQARDSKEGNRVSKSSSAIGYLMRIFDNFEEKASKRVTSGAGLVREAIHFRTFSSNFPVSIISRPRVRGRG